MMEESGWDLIELADQAYNRGGYQQAIGLYESAVAQSSQSGQERAGLVALNSICFCYAAIPDWENCLKAATRLLARARTLESPEYEMRAVFHLAQSMAAIDLEGRWSELKPLLLQGIERARQFRNVFWQIRHLVLLAACELQLDDTESAFSRLQDALNLVPSDRIEQDLKASIYATLALVHLNRGNYRDAKFYMEMAGGLVQALRDVHGITDLSLLETYINVMADEDFQVPEFVGMALSTAGSSGWKGTEFLACWLEAFRLAKSGRIEEALNLLRRASELARAMRSKLAEAACLVWLAYELIDLDDVIQTSQYLHAAFSLLGQLRERSTRALPLAEMAAYIQTRLAQLQRERGELSEALALTEDALATWRRLNIEFRIVEATALKVQLLVDLGLRDAAQATCQEVLASGIKGDDNYNTIGLRAYKDLNDLDGAERAFRLCLEQQPKHASAWNNLAYVLYDRGEVDEAVRCWRESLKLRRENAPSAGNLAGLALGLWMQGRRDESVKIFRQALSLEPRYADPDWLAREPFWSQKAIEAARPLIGAARAATPEQSTGDAA